VVPPTVLFALSINTPPELFPTATVPVASVPMKLPATVFCWLAPSPM
jgi:hypothetical protein